MTEAIASTGMTNSVGEGVEQEQGLEVDSDAAVSTGPRPAGDMKREVGVMKRQG